MTGRKVHLEWMRAIAIVLVVFNHLPGYIHFRDAQGADRALCLLLAMLTRVNVPLFLMVSGAVLLGRSEPCGVLLKRRVPRIAAVIALFSAGLEALHYVYYVWVRGEAYALTLSGFLRALLSGTVTDAGSYWFLYAYLGFLLLLPFLRRAAQGMNGREAALLIALHALVASLLPALNLLLRSLGQAEVRFNYYFNLPLATTQVFFYPLIGYYLENRVDEARLSRGRMALIAALGLAGLVLAALCTVQDARLSGKITENYVQMFDYAAAFAAFLLIKRLVCVTAPALSRGRAARVACRLGSVAFGIYLLDPFLKLVLWGPYTRLAGALHPVVLSLLWCALSVAMGGTIALLLKKLPVFRRLL